MIDVALARVDTDVHVNDLVPPLVATIGLDRDPTRLVVDGEVVAVVAPFPGDLAAYRRAVRTLPMPTTVVRGAGMRSRSQTFGFAARNGIIRRAACTSCGVATSPAHTTICGTAAVLAYQLAELAPDAHAALTRYMTEVHPDWHLPGGLWTSGILNRTASLPYHHDRNNFDAWSAMPVVRSRVTGGHLSLPELGTVIECRDGAVVYFNGTRWLHGVTPIVDRMKSGYRYSAVYYPIRNMRKCLPADEELARARTSRVTNEAGLLERQRKAGLIR